jgi:hypothetical protein
MNNRTKKTFALIATGGLLLQLGGCGSFIAEILIQQVPTLVLGLLSQLLSSGTTA